jgi:glycosyltransferase involved in cell wall biosynthesis
MKPLVTVICISYNHAPFIKEAIESLFNQRYDNIEIIIADDASTDESQAFLQSLISDKPEIKSIFHDSNIGYTKTFNEAFGLAQGKYIIDFALDDVMLPDFVLRSVSQLEQVGEDFGVSFSNANYIDAGSLTIGNHNGLLKAKGLMHDILSGDLFAFILRRYFICTPSMVMRKSVLDRLNGYDTSLAYEDFDFWVRSSRFTGYTYINDVLVNKRKLKNLMSSQQYDHRQNLQLESTLKVCNKALHLCKTKTELNALADRVNFELRYCLTSGAFDLAREFLELLKILKENSFRRLVYKTLLALKMNYQFLNKSRKKGSF